MKNIFTLIFILLNLLSISHAQSEPEKINAKDLIDKIERSDLSNDKSNSELGDAIPELEIPNINFNSNKSKISHVIGKPKIEETVELSKRPKPSKTIKTKILIAKKSLSISDLLKNDKIVKGNSFTYVYRIINKSITQFILKEKMPFNSFGLKAFNKNSYYVVDVALVTKDARTLNANITSNTNSSKDNIKNSKPKNSKTKKMNPNTLSINNRINQNKLKNIFEEKYNQGRKITRTLKKNELIKGDKIIISDGIQLVIRKTNSAVLSVKKYWLIETIDVNNDSLVKESNTVYKLTNSYH